MKKVIKRLRRWLRNRRHNKVKELTEQNKSLRRVIKNWEARCDGYQLRINRIKDRIGSARQTLFEVEVRE